MLSKIYRAFLHVMPGWPAEWTAKDWRAMAALLFSVLGAGVASGLAAWLVWILSRGGWSALTEAERVRALAKALNGAIFINGMVLLTLGFAINRREITGKIGGAEFTATGGDEDGKPRARRTVVTSAAVTETVTSPVDSATAGLGGDDHVS